MASKAKADEPQPDNPVDEAQPDAGADEAQPDAGADEAQPDTPAADPGPTPVRLVYAGTPWSGTLSVGDQDYAVTDGVVDVPAEAVAAAQQAGFRA